MGVDLGEVLQRRKILLDDLTGRSLAVDAYNTLYQFLAIIRQPDGTPLMDKERRVTSHLSGILYRTANLSEKGVRVVYVFDGQPPEMKEMEIKRRRRIREEAAVRYEAALKAGSTEDARKYAQATATVRELMIEDSKRLLKGLGIPWVQAPSEGEAQAAHMAIKGDVWAAASQDHDSLLFGAPRMVKNLTMSGRRKLPNRQAYVEIEPEIFELAQTLAELGLTREQLVDVGILVGTDYNPDGVKGIGPKTVHCLLLFGLGREAFPVDTHILRVGKRLGFIPEEIDAEKAHAWMVPLVPGGKALSLHINLIRHGRFICIARRPRCSGCLLQNECIYDLS